MRLAGLIYSMTWFDIRFKKHLTMRGSNCVPALTSSSFIASFLLIAFLYALSLVIASYASTTEMMRHSKGMLSFLQPSRVSVSIPAFMVREDIFGDNCQFRRVLRDPITDLGVPFHFFPFHGRQRAGFLQHTLMDPDFTDIVKNSEQRELVHFLRRQFQFASYCHTIFLILISCSSVSLLLSCRVARSVVMIEFL